MHLLLTAFLLGLTALPGIAAILGRPFDGLAAAILSVAAVAGWFGLIRQQRIRQAHLRFALDREADFASHSCESRWETDAHFLVTLANGDVAGLLLGRNLTELSEAQDASRSRRDKQARLGAHTTFSDLPVIVEGPKRARVHLLLSGNPVTGPDGTFCGYRGVARDLTAEIRRNLRADVAERLLQTTIDYLPQGVSVMDRHLNMVSFNRALLRLLEFPADRFRPGDNLEKFFRYNAERGEYGDGDADELVVQRMELARRAKPHVFERTRPDGTVIEVRGNPVPGGGFVTLYSDVTERRRLEDELGLATTIFESLAPTLVTDTDQRILRVNKAFTRAIGYPMSELLGQGVSLLRSQRQELDPLEQMSRDTGAVNQWKGEVWVRCKDGADLLQWMSVTAVRGPSDQVTRYVATFADISEFAQQRTMLERTAAEEVALGALLRYSIEPRELPDYLQRCLESLLITVPWLKNLPAGAIFLSGREGVDKELEFAAVAGLAAEHDTLRTRILAERYAAGTGESGESVRFLETAGGDPGFVTDGRPVRGCYDVALLHEGNLLGVLALWMPAGLARARHEKAFLARVGDVLSMGISRRYANEELVDAKNQAEAASRSRGDFLASMSHEIRTPMNGVLGMVQLLRETSLSVEQRDFVETIHESGNALLAIINDILDFSKIESGKIVFENIAFEIEAATYAAVSVLSPSAHEKSVQLLLRVAPECPPQVLGDAGRLRQILLNLVSNAIKFTQRGHVLVEVSCGGREPGRERIHFAVHDTGIGVEAGVRDRLFDSFTQADASTTRRYGGTGLGLAICKRLVEGMGGEIGLESSPGAGSTFWFSLPLLVGETPKRVPEPALQGAHVLLIDDSPVLRRVLSEQFESLGMRVESAHSQGSALARVRRASERGEPFDVVVAGTLFAADGSDELLPETGAPWVVLSTTLAREREAGEGPVSAFPRLTMPASRETLRGILAGAIRDFTLSHESVQPPVAPVEEQTPAQPVELPDPQGPLFESRVLLAEDDSTNRRVAKAVLNKLGLRVEVAMNGREAVEHSEHNEVELILMDCQMPDVDGFEATRRIRQRERLDGGHVPIVALTANALDDDRRKCLDAGMDAFMAKPFAKDQLVEILREWLPPARTVASGED